MSAASSASPASPSSSHRSKAERPTVPTPAILLRPRQAAAAMGMSQDYFDAHVRPFVKSIRGHRMRLYPVQELRAWAATNATPAIEERP